MLGDEGGHGLGGGLDGRADGELLDVGEGDLVVGAEAGDPLGELVPAGAEDVQEAVLALEGVLLAGHAGSDEERGGDAGACAVPAEHERLLDVLGVAGPGGDAGGLLSGVGEGVAHALGVESHERGRGGGRAEHGADGVGGVAVHAAGVDAAHEARDARADVVAEGHGAEEGLAGGVLAFGHRQGGGDNGAAGMREGRGVGIVGLVGVGEHTVGHGALMAVVTTLEPTTAASGTPPGSGRIRWRPPRA